MSDNYIQTVAAVDGTTTVQATLNGVVAGSTIVAWLGDGSKAAGPTTHTVADGQGSYTARGPAGLDAGDLVWIQQYTLENANAGTHVITGTIDTGDGCFLKVAEVGATGTGSTSGANSGFQSAPGTGTDVLSSGTVTVTGAATLMGLSTDSASTDPLREPTAGTGFTGRDAGASPAIGAWRIESKAVAANAAATFTAITGTDNYVTLGVAILNSSGGGGPTPPPQLGRNIYVMP